MKQIKDYIHLYIGSPARIVWSDDPEKTWPCDWNGASIAASDVGEYKLALRPLSDMTDEEWDDYHRLYAAYLAPNAEATMRRDAALTKYLISRGLDVFDLIVFGLAIDATKLPSHEPRH